jgi:integrase
VPTLLKVEASNTERLVSFMFEVNKYRGHWRLFLVEYENSKRTRRHISVNEYPRLGLSKDMPIETARDVARSLNARHRIIKEEAIRKSSLINLKDRRRRVYAVLPKALVEEFEKELVSFQDPGQLKANKALSHWERVKTLLVDLQLTGSDTHSRRDEIYRYFAHAKISFDYARKLVNILNRWTEFLARKAGTFFIPLKAPTGTARERIVDTYFDEKGRGKESTALTIQMLALAKTRLTASQYNWLALSLWFGLRPSEVDSLTKPEQFKISVQQGYKVLEIFQKKLSGIARSRRWKRVPVIFDEQGAALSALPDIRRPLVKTLKKHLDAGLTCYGGRKGFTDLMLERGQDFHAISQWLGHQSIDRTWRNYKDKEKLLLPKKNYG